MTDGGDSEAQSTFGDFGAGDERPAGEAEHVAGNGGQHAELVDIDEERFPPTDERVEFSVTQVDYTVEGYGDDEFPVLHVFGRTAADEGDPDPVHARVYGFRPYFYTPLAKLDHRESEGPVTTDDLTDSRIVEEARLTGVETYGDLRADGHLVDEEHADDELVVHRSIRDEDLVKVFGQTPRDVGQLRDQFDHYEADILFPNRLLIDKDINSGVSVPAREGSGEALRVHHTEIAPVDLQVSPRVNTFDIEVDDRSGFPEDGEEPIVCLTSHDSYDDEYVVWLYTAPDGIEGPEDLSGYEAIGESDIDVEVRTFERESEMLAEFIEYLRESDPDVFTGWNCLPADSEIQMADGTTTQIADIEIGDEVVGSENRLSAVAEVTNKWQSEKAVRKLELADGSSLRSSADHRIMVGDDDTVDWKRGEEIEVGDYVLKPRSFPVSTPEVPQLDDLVPTEFQRFGSKDAVKEFKSGLPNGSISELSERWDVTTDSLYHPHTTVWTVDRCRQAGEAFDTPLPDGGRTYRGTDTDLNRQLTKQEVYLAGLVLTDGTMSEEYGVRFYNSREELHAQFPGDRALTPDAKGSYKQNVLDYAMLYAFRALGIPFGDKNAVDIDLSPVFGMPEEYVARFLAGAIDGDGNVSSSVTVAAQNSSIGDWYVRLFRRLGIYAQRRDNVVRIPDAAREIDRLKEAVLPHMNHSEKVEKLRELDGGKSGQTENIPYALFEAEAGTDAKRIGRDKHRRGINLKRHETDCDDWDDYVFVRVEGVAEVGTETTYDIETTTHDFVAEGCLVHNCDDFDIPYLIDRIERLADETDADPELMDSDRLSRLDEVWDSGWGGPNVKGRVVFDLLYAYKRRQFTELESYRLDAVGETELGVGKERYTGDIGDLWEQDPERLLEYNLRDVELCVEIDRRQEVIPFWEEVASFVGCKLEDATTPGDAVDLYILHEVHGDFALPSKGAVESEDYEGGAVFDPITGVRENVSVLDLKSLYPMCMVTLNLSPETYVADPESYAGDTYVAPNGMHFQKEPDGIIREMVTNLLEERENKKALRDEHEPGTESYATYDSQQAAVKVIMNSLYGVLGWDRFRLYDKDMGAAVTATGREVISFTEQSVQELGHEVAYGDSVTGDRPVVVRDPDGMVRIVEIAQLFERANTTTDDSVLITADGGPVGEVTTGKERGELLGWDALSLSNDGDAEWQPIEQVIRHETDDPVVRLQHKFGESTTTRDHSYVTESDGAFVETPPADVETPLRIPGLPEVRDVERVDVYEVLDGYARTYEDGRGGKPGESVEKTKRVHTDGEWVWFGHEHLGDIDSTVKVRRYVERGTSEFEGLLRLLAAYITEGSASTKETTDSRFGASISEERTGWLEGLREDYYRLFENVEASIVTSDSKSERTVEYENAGGPATATYDDRTSKLQMMNELSAVFFREFAGQTSRGKRIPSFVFHLDEDEQSLFLDTLIEGDGSRAFPRYSEAYAERNFDFETTSRELAAGLSMLLTQRGQKHSLKYRESKGSYTLRTCDFYRGGRDPVLTEVDHDSYVYDLSVAENENFVDGVGGIVLHNTDSVMIELGGDVSREEAIEQSLALEENINDSYADLAASMNADEHRFQIEFEKLYRRFFQAGKKKRYAGHIVWKEGKDVDDIDITGFEYKRSDIAPITKEVQKEVIEMVVTGTDLDEVKDYVHDIIEEFQEENVPLERIGIPGGIGKKLDAYDTDTAQVRGAKYANMMLGTNFGRGSKPKRLYLSRVHDNFFQRVESEMGLSPSENALYGEFKREQDVICFEFEDQIPEEFEVDWDKMLDRTLKGPIERILEALDVSWEEVKSGQEQTGLGSFM